MWGCAGVLPPEHSQVGDVFGEVAGDAGQLLVGAVHDGALAAAPVWAHEVHEALAAEPAAVILRAWGAKEGRQHHQPGPGQGCGDGGYGWGGCPEPEAALPSGYGHPAVPPAPQPPGCLLPFGLCHSTLSGLTAQTLCVLKLRWVTQTFFHIGNLVYNLGVS